MMKEFFQANVRFRSFRNRSWPAKWGIDLVLFSMVLMLMEAFVTKIMNVSLAHVQAGVLGTWLLGVIGVILLMIDHKRHHVPHD
jgi:hypothetical protein